MSLPIGLAFSLSFCSFGYQQLLALALYDVSGDYVLSQSLTLALFLLGLGLGGLKSGDKASWPRLLKVEWRLALVGAFSVHVVQLTEIGLTWMVGPPVNALLWVGVAPLVFTIGFLTGFEIPHLLKLAPQHRTGALFAANYTGAFTAAVTVPLWLFPNLDVTGSALALSLINFLAATALLAKAGRAHTPWLHALVGVALVAIFSASTRLSGFHLQTVYFPIRLSDSASLLDAWNILNRLETPIRLRSPYQWIDLVPPEFSERIQGRQDFQIYLDRKIQLSSGSLKRYHQSLVHGTVNLLGSAPRRALILGGGDGLLAREILTYDSVERIDLVELDPTMIGLANGQRELARFNARALMNPKVSVHVMDAFRFVRSAKDTYDLILIDLPFPVTYDLSLLYTKEFYALVKRRLAGSGVVALDFPLPGGSQDDLPTLVATLAAAGFAQPFAFGSEDFFVAAAADGRALTFKYSTLFAKVADQTLSNLVSRTEDLARARASGGRVNSVLFPVRFSNRDDKTSAGAPRPERLISHWQQPGFLPPFLERFNRAWQEETGWPALALSSSIAEPRDFSEAIGEGHLQPRVQWGFEVRGDQLTPLYQWWDARFPERLREEWERLHGPSDAHPWIGVTWSPDQSVVEFHVFKEGRMKVRVYRQSVFKGEYDADSYLRIEAIGTWPPILEHPGGRAIQQKLQQRFLMFPRFHVRAARTDLDGHWERIYFP